MGLLWVRFSIKLLSYHSVVLNQSQGLCEAVGSAAYFSTGAFAKVGCSLRLSGYGRFVGLNRAHCDEPPVCV